MAIKINGLPESLPPEVKEQVAPQLNKPLKSSELSAVLAAITKEKGKGVVLKGNETPIVTRIPTGVFEFDLATGGGFPVNKVSIIYGPESCNKTNTCLKAVASMQKRQGENNKVVWVDLEHSYDQIWARMMGVDVDNLIVLKPGYGEEAVDLIDAVVHAEDVGLVVVDSIAVMTSAKELEQSTEKFDVGTAPMLVKRLSNKLSHAMSVENRRDHKPTVILVNQTRFKVGVMFGDPENMPGGQAIRFLSSLTIRQTGKNKIVKEYHPEKAVFKTVSGTIKKSKVPVSSNSFEYDMAVVNLPELKIGETASWSQVSNHLKAMGLLAKPEKGQGWTLLGKLYPSLIPLQDQYMADQSFAIQMQQLVIDNYASKMFTIDVK